MTLPSHPPVAEPRSSEMLARLVESANMINRIHEALRSTLQIENLCDIAVGILFSDRGMGFSRSIILRWDEKDQSYRLCSALGAVDASGHEQLRSEISNGLRGDEPVPVESIASEEPSEVKIFSHEDSKDLPAWSRLNWQSYHQNPLIKRLGGLTLKDTGEAGSIGARVFAAKTCVQLNDKAAQAQMPGELKDVLAADALWAGIKTKKSKFMVICDKAFEERPIDEVDRIHMNWFTTQVALAMENAELFSELAETNAGLQELDTLKSNFLSTISHELRTPLTAITGFSRLLINNKVGMITPGQKQILDRVLAHSERLVNVVNDLIEIAEIDSGSAVNLRVHPVDPLNVLMETLPKLEPRLKSKTVTVEPVVTTAVPKIMADEKGLGRIFYHLIDNAVKFSRENGKVKIEFTPGERDLSIHITDQGIGIPPERLRLIFEAFYQVDSQLARVYEGMGIGLTLTKKLVAGTGGRLVVQSELGQGSTFTMIYPKA